MKKMFKNIPDGKRCLLKSKKGWLDDVENCLKELDAKRVDKNS